MKKPTLLVLFSYKKGSLMYEPYQNFVQPIKKELVDFDVEQGALKELIFHIKKNSLKVIDPTSNVDISKYSMVHFRTWQKKQSQAKAVATHLLRTSTPFFSREPARISNNTKLTEYASMADGGVPLIDTVCSSSRQLSKLFTQDNPPISFPILIKPIDGSLGEDISVASNYSQLKHALKSNPQITFMIQKFIPNDFDYRILISDGEPQLVIKRTRNDGVVNNTTQGASAQIIELDQISKEILDDAALAASLLKRSDFCGVDIVVNSETQEHYILEVNKTPQIETGVFVDKKLEVLARYIRTHYKKDTGV